jgi:uncharacterized membrane protein YuzA (DUF378 family)
MLANKVIVAGCVGWRRGCVMVLRKHVVSLALVAALLGTSLSPSRATVISIAPPPAATAAGTGAGAWAAGGIIGVAAVLCLVDFFQKVAGVKNWDGTPKVVQPHHHHR